MAYDQFECYVTGISIAEKQVEFSQAKAMQRNIQGKVSFHLRNMLDNGFPDSFFQAVLNNESTMYVNLDKLFSEHARVLKTGGRFVCITGCYDDSNYGLPSRSVSKINSHYICNIHSHSEYISALSNNNFEIKEDMDLTKMTIPYWELRKTTALATGIEAAFLEAYKSGGLQYRLLAADRV